MVLFSELIVRLLNFLRLGLGRYVKNFVVTSLRPDHLAKESKLGT